MLPGQRRCAVDQAAPSGAAQLLGGDELRAQAMIARTGAVL
ncbi:hypothetical protein [Streptomyces graminilatus]|nr:hypothetical protein [Streptomyces graminilatus]